MSDELKPCPFCGGSEPDVAVRPDVDSDGKRDIIAGPYWSVMCAYCDAEGPPGWDVAHDKTKELKSTKEAAIKAWNKRG